MREFFLTPGILDIIISSLESVAVSKRLTCFHDLRFDLVWSNRKHVIRPGGSDLVQFTPTARKTPRTN